MLIIWDNFYRKDRSLNCIGRHLSMKNFHQRTQLSNWQQLKKKRNRTERKTILIDQSVRWIIFSWHSSCFSLGQINVFHWINFVEIMSILFYSLNNSVFTNFAFYSTASVLKLMAIGALTTVKRLSKDVNRKSFEIFKEFLCSSQVYANQEDLVLARDQSISIRIDDSVERVRRNHLNDIENIVPFVLVGIFYVGTNPDRHIALWHFRIFFISRLIHTIAYQVNFNSKHLSMFPHLFF